MDAKEMNILTGNKVLPRIPLQMQMYRKDCNDCHVDFYITLDKVQHFLHRFYLVDALGLGRYDENKLEKFINWTTDSLVKYTEELLKKTKKELNDQGWTNIKMTYKEIVSNLCAENR
jgi:hypothetical protein